MSNLETSGDPAALCALARRWLACFNARDLEGLLALYAEDAVHTSPKLRDRRPETRGEVRGKAALREWWADAMQRLPQLHYDERHLTTGPGRVVMEYLRVCPPEPELLVAEVLVVERGIIVASHVFHG
jgi:ketosteroid isomerase-like protein